MNILNDVPPHVLLAVSNRAKSWGLSLGNTNYMMPQLKFFGTLFSVMIIYEISSFPCRYFDKSLDKNTP